MEAETRHALGLPPLETLREIERKQNERAESIRRERAHRLAAAATTTTTAPDVDERVEAATLIQKNYRGHRDRRALQGHGLDPSTRWLEALKDAQYRHRTRPLPPTQAGSSESLNASGGVRERWKRVGAVAHRAGSDDTSEGEDDGAEEEKRRKKAERDKYARIMGLEYFLEMVDHQHRYGSNLRRYHKEWQQADTKENFFYWLDYGEGKNVDLEDRPRTRLDTEHVRYLSKEERLKYLVRIDEHGRFCWDKNGLPVHTSADYRDSMDGIVPASDDTPTWREVTIEEQAAPARPLSPAASMSSASTDGRHDEEAEDDVVTGADGKQAKLHHISVDSLMKHLVHKNTTHSKWIFVADTSFRLYMGIKQPGAFQHSSFLKGARVSAAGVVKIKRGQIRQLSPLSGHYAPPVRNFRCFVRALQEAGADLSRLNVSRSYAVILGLEGYVQLKTRAGRLGHGMQDLVLLGPDGRRRRQEAALDQSESARRERRILEAERRRQGTGHRLMQKLSLADE